MNIQTIQQHHASYNRQKTVKDRLAVDMVSKALPQDTYEPSRSDIREDLVKSVQKRIANGYYNSHEVIDDVSESFAKVLSQVS
jgi:hypothetical protein